LDTNFEADKAGYEGDIPLFGIEILRSVLNQGRQTGIQHQNVFC
jgi:hypothetical protein